MRPAARLRSGGPPSGPRKETAADFPALTPDTPDADLVEALRAVPLAEPARSRALGLLFQRHDGRARVAIRQAFRRCGLEPVDAEDVLQEAHVKAAAGLRGLEGPALFGPWLAAIARNEARSKIRSLLSRHHYECEPCEAGPREQILLALFDWPGAGEDALIARLDAAQWLVLELARLPERARRALWLAVAEGFSHAEVARRLGVAIGTIASDLCRARRRMLRRRKGLP